MEFRGRVYLGVEKVTELPESPEVSLDLARRMDVARARVKEVIDAIPGAAERIWIGAVQPVANPFFDIEHGLMCGRAVARIAFSLALVENWDRAEIDHAVKHEVAHLDQEMEGDPLEASAMKYAQRHGIGGPAKKAMEMHYIRRRQLDADWRAVKVYRASAKAAETGLHTALAMRRELGIGMDYETRDWHLNSLHPHLDVRFAQLRELDRMQQRAGMQSAEVAIS